MRLLAPLRRALVRRRCHIVALDRIEDLVDGPVPSGVELRPIAESDVGRVRDFRDEHVAVEFRRLLAEGHRGVFAWRGDELVGHFWAVLARAERRRMWGGVDFGPDETLLAWGHVRREHRGNGIFQAMIRRLVRVAFAEEGTGRVLADLPVGVPASLAAHRNCGFRVLGELRYASVCGVVLGRRFDSTP